MKAYIAIFLIVNLILYLSTSFYACSFDITKLGETPRFVVSVTFAMINLSLLACFAGIYAAKMPSK